MSETSGPKLASPPANNDAGEPGGSRFSHLYPLLAVLSAVFLWSCTTIVVRYVRFEIPPLGLAFWRNFTAFLLLLPIVAVPAWRQWPLMRKHLPILALLGLLLWVGGNALLFLSLQYTYAINAGVINSVEPIMIMVLASLLFRDTLTRLQIIGVLISLAGVLAIVSAGSIERLLQLELNRGDLIVTCAYTFWGLYAVLLRKAPRDLDHRVMLGGIIFFGTLFTLPLYIAETLIARPFPFTPKAGGVVLIMAIFPSLLAMLAWNYSIRQMGAIRAGQFLHLIPAFTVILAILLLGETLGVYHFVGVALIAAGLWVSARR